MGLIANFIYTSRSMVYLDLKKLILIHLKFKSSAYTYNLKDKIKLKNYIFLNLYWIVY